MTISQCYISFCIRSTSASPDSMISFPTCNASWTIFVNSSSLTPRPAEYPSASPTDSQNTTFRRSETEFRGALATTYLADVTSISLGDASKKIVLSTYGKIRKFEEIRYWQLLWQEVSTSLSSVLTEPHYPRISVYVGWFFMRRNYPIVIDLEDSFFMRFSSFLHIHYRGPFLVRSIQGYFLQRYMWNQTRL